MLRLWQSEAMVMHLHAVKYGCFVKIQGYGSQAQFALSFVLHL